MFDDRFTTVECHFFYFQGSYAEPFKFVLNQDVVLTKFRVGSCKMLDGAIFCTGHTTTVVFN